MAQVKLVLLICTIFMVQSMLGQAPKATKMLDDVNMKPEKLLKVRANENPISVVIKLTFPFVFAVCIFKSIAEAW